MLVVIPFSHKDSALAVDMLKWTRELCGKLNHPCALIASRGMPKAQVDAVAYEAGQTFSKTSIVTPSSANELGWPESANHLFRTAVSYVTQNKLGAFYWLEADCTPLKSDWLDQIESAYVKCGKPYMGFRRDVPIPHISGPAVYPGDVAKYNPGSLKRIKTKLSYMPFDVIDGHKTLQHAHVTDLIFHEWGDKDFPPSFPFQSSLEKIPPAAVIHHRCKDASLIARLRERNKGATLIGAVKNLFTQKKQTATAVVQLGRYGDIINILPICKHLADKGEKVHLVVSKDFESLLDGVSYVKPVAMPVPFRKLTEVITDVKANYAKVIRCQVYGENFQQSQFAPTYNQEEWREAGFWSEFNNPNWKPVFDKRDKERESALAKRVFKTDKPKIVCSLSSGLTAPFSGHKAVFAALVAALPQYEVVEIGSLKAERIYDILGLYDRAELIVSTDTATLHLAAACDTPLYAILNNVPWLGSSVRYNCLGSIKYDQASPQKVAEGVKLALKTRLNAETKSAITRPVKPGKRIDLSRVTLWACCWSDDQNNLRRTLRVLRFCNLHFRFGRTLLLSYLPLPHQVGFGLDVEQIPKLEFSQWNTFHTRIVPKFINSPYAMSVHEDGFPTHPELWQDKFLDYDFIGAPWFDGVVGNAGFCIESQRFLQAKMTVPFSNEPTIPSDTFLCRTHRDYLESKGMRFAPTELAIEFSTEQTGRQWPSLGFHGRLDSKEKYELGWQLIKESEL